MLIQTEWQILRQIFFVIFSESFGTWDNGIRGKHGIIELKFSNYDIKIFEIFFLEKMSGQWNVRKSI